MDSVDLDVLKKRGVPMPIVDQSREFTHRAANPNADTHACFSPSTQADNSVPAIAAVLYEHGDPVEELMAAVAQTLSHNSVRVGGLVQHNHRAGQNARC